MTVHDLIAKLDGLGHSHSEVMFIAHMLGVPEGDAEDAYMLAVAHRMGLL